MGVEDSLTGRQLGQLRTVLCEVSGTRAERRLENWPSPTSSLAERSASCPGGVESRLTKHFSISGLAVMDFDD